MRGYSLGGAKFELFLLLLESRRPPRPPGCPATGTQAHDRSRELRFGRPAPVGATPVADQPFEPLRGELEVVTFALRK